MRHNRKAGILTCMICSSVFAQAGWNYSNTAGTNWSSFINPAQDNASNWDWWDDNSWPIISASGEIISSPFDENSSYYPVGFDPSKEKVYPEYGWLMYQRRLFERDKKPTSLQSGPWTFGQYGENSIPYFVLYNMYTSQLRIFAYLGDIDPISNGRMVVSVSTSSPNSSILQMNNGMLPNPGQKFNAVLPNSSPQNGRWVVATFYVAYDPTMASREESIVFEFKQIGSADFMAQGEFAGLACQDMSQCPASPTPPSGMTLSSVGKTVGQFGESMESVPYSKIGSVLRWYGSKLDGYAWLPTVTRYGMQRDRQLTADNRAFPNIKTQGVLKADLNSFANAISDYNSPLRKTMSIVSAGLPYVGSALGILGTFAGDQAAPPPPLVLGLTGKINLSGSITSQIPYATTYDGVSGSSFYSQFERIPYYAKVTTNSLIGNWTVTKKPALFVVQSHGATVLWTPVKYTYPSTWKYQPPIDPLPSEWETNEDRAYVTSTARYTTNSSGDFKAWVGTKSSPNGTIATYQEYNWDGRTEQYLPGSQVSTWKETSADWVKPQRWVFVEKPSSWIADNPMAPQGTSENFIGLNPIPETRYQSAATGQVTINGAPMWSRRALDLTTRDTPIDPIRQEIAYHNEPWMVMPEDIPSISLVRSYLWKTNPNTIVETTTDAVDVATEVYYITLPPGFLQYIPPQEWSNAVQKWLNKYRNFPTHTRSFSPGRLML